MVNSPVMVYAGSKGPKRSRSQCTFIFYRIQTKKKEEKKEISRERLYIYLVLIASPLILQSLDLTLGGDIITCM